MLSAWCGCCVGVVWVRAGNSAHWGTACAAAATKGFVHSLNMLPAESQIPPNPITINIIKGIKRFGGSNNALLQGAVIFRYRWSKKASWKRQGFEFRAD